MTLKKFQTWNGDRYRLVAREEGLLPHGVAPLAFYDSDSAVQFIRNLKASESEWRDLLRLFGDDLNPNSVLQIEQVFADKLIKGKLRAVKLSSKTTSTNAPTSFSSGTGVVYQIQSSVDLLESDGSRTKQMTDVAQAEKFIESLGASEKQLETIAKDLGLDETETLKKPMFNQANPSKTDQIKQKIAQALSDNDAVVVEKSVAAPPASESSSSQGDSEVGHMPGNRAASLGPVANEVVTQQEEEKVCSLSEFTLKCSHANRGYQLNVISDENNLNGGKGLQVISNPNKPDELSVSMAGNCVNGNDCPALEVYQGGSLIESYNTGAHTFKVFPKKRDYSQESFTEFYRRFLLPNIDKSFDYETYHLKSCGCESCQKHEATIHAFPNFKWSGKIGLGYADISKKAEARSEEGWFVSGEIGLELGGDEWKYAAKQDFTIDSLFPSLQDSLGGLFDTIEDVTKTPKKSRDTAFALEGHNTTDKELVKFKFTPPNISLGGGVELKEVDGSNNVDLEGTLELGLSPLVKADLSTDVFDWLIVLASSAAAGPAGTQFGKFLVRVKGWAADRGAVVQAIFNIEGAVEAKLEWTKKAGDSWKAIGGASEAQASLTMGLKAEVSIEKTIWKMSAKAGAELYVKGATTHKEGVGLIAKLQSGEVDGKPAIDGTLTFTGLGIYYAYYAELGVKDEQTEKGPKSVKSSGGGFKKKKKKQELKRKREKVEKLWTVLEAKTWFNDESPRTINEAQL